MVLRRSVSASSLTSSLASSVSSYKSCSTSGHDVNPELEDLAEQLEERLRREGRVKERSGVLKKKITNAFVGSEAVAILQELLQAKREREEATALKLPNEEEQETHSGSVTGSREEALEVGRQIATELGFFKHANAKATLNLTTETPLMDSSKDYYQFHNNLPKHVAAMKKQYKTHWDKMRLMEEHIECKDRWYFPRVYQDCFVAKEAVDKLMELKIVRSRGEAVDMVRRLNQKVFCCQHVTSEHEFKDEYLYFTFVPKDQRMPEPPPRKTSSKSPSRRKQKDKLAKARKESQKKIRDRRCRSMSHVNPDLQEDSVSWQQQQQQPSNSNDSNSTLSTAEMQHSAPSLLGDMSILDQSHWLEEPDDLLKLNATTAPLATPTHTTNTTSIPKANSTGGINLQTKQQKANRKRANDIRTRLANYHQERIAMGQQKNNANETASATTRESIQERLAQGRKSLEKAKTELILEVPLKQIQACMDC